MSLCNSYVYKEKEGRPGHCIIINNTELRSSNRSKKRAGSEHDVESLEKVFNRLGFKITKLENYGAEDLQEAVETIARDDHSEYSCMIMFIMTHGTEDGEIFCADYVAFPLEDLFEPFKGDSCSSLKGKPKIFVVEAGRGEAVDVGTEENDAAVVSRPTHIETRIPHEADCLYVYSTTPGYISWRRTSSGSFYIQEFCSVLDQHFDELATTPFILVLDHINHRMAHEKVSKHTKEEYNQCKQMPQFISQLSKTFFLKPAKK